MRDIKYTREIEELEFKFDRKSNDILKINRKIYNLKLKFKIHEP